MSALCDVCGKRELSSDCSPRNYNLCEVCYVGKRFIICDICEKPRASYYNCYDCESYDLCEVCYVEKRRLLHNPSHEFAFIKQDDIINGCCVEKNQGIVSKEGEYVMIFQQDGNLCIYEKGIPKTPETVRWESKTSHQFVEFLCNNMGVLQFLTKEKVVVKEMVVDITINGLKAMITSKNTISWDPDFKGRNVAIAKIVNHEGFKLVSVDELGNMSLVSPQKDPELQKKILQEGYRCISHMWGDWSNSKWEDHRVDGVEYGVYVREEKRKKLLQLFRYYKGYWWMDVLCTNQEAKKKVLNIMGDIYKNCTECICLIDGDVGEYVPDYDINSYPHSLRVKNELEGKDYHDLYHVLCRCKWITRVWTLQEVMLPSAVYFTKEKPDLSGIYRLDLDDIRTDLACLEKTEFGAANYLSSSFKLLLSIPEAKWVEKLEKMHKIAFSRDRSCSRKEDYYYGVSGLFNISIPNDKTAEEAMLYFLKGLPNTGIYPIMNSYITQFNYGKINDQRFDVPFQNAADAVEWYILVSVYTNSSYAKGYIGNHVEILGILRKKKFVGNMECTKNASWEFPPQTEVDFTYDLMQELDEKSIVYMLENVDCNVRHWEDKHISITDTHMIITSKELDFAVGDKISFGVVNTVNHDMAYICDVTEDKLIKPYGTFVKFREISSRVSK